jgi:hypothetical protein
LTSITSRIRHPDAIPEKSIPMRTIRTAAAILLGALVLILAARPAPADAIAVGRGPYRSVSVHERHGGQLRAVNPGRIPHTRLPGPLPKSGEADTLNWSGYAVTACGSCHLRYVAADFTLPRVNCANSPDGSWDSFWVGLDGWTTGTVEQDGIDAECSGGGVSYYVFTEMYPAGPLVYQLAAQAGDNIEASVYYDQSARVWSLAVDDTTAGASATVSASCAAGASCYNRSAEVITEAPCCTTAGAPLALADFGQVNYSGARVTSYNGTRGGLSPISLWTSTTVTLVDSGGSVEASAGPLLSGTVGGIPVSDFSGYWAAST